MQSTRPQQAEFPIQLVWLVSLGLLALGFAIALDDIVVWAVCALALPVALSIAGGRRLLVAAGGSICFFWAAIFSDLLGRAINPAFAVIPEMTTTSSAIYLSLAALCVIAVGYRFGVAGRVKLREQRAPELDITKISIVYGISVVIVFCLSIIASYIPALTQPVLAFQAIKLICLYLLTAQVFRDGRGYSIVVIALLAEIVSGLTGYIAHFQAPLFIIIAGAVSGRKLQGGQWVAAFALVIVLFYVSVVWSGIKPNYRTWLAGNGSAGTSEKAYWIYNRVANEGLDYQDAFGRLTKRLGYTHMLSMTMIRADNGVLPPTSYYIEAIERIVTPRFLFPDKAAINDTAVAKALTGQSFGEGTSVSVGYLAQAYADFAFPTLFVPIFLIGFLQGRVVRYFLNRPISPVARGAFASASVVTMFSYEFNIDKALGGFVLTFLALLLLEYALYRKFESSITRKASASLMPQIVSGHAQGLHSGLG